ncbi:MAG: 50S ribosomal protein L11 methyltransferase [Paludibacteraceae bacterium]|nr:50S ribosomal protein L11 methyltransferase [Paludibacteraceae bacterium]
MQYLQLNVSTTSLQDYEVDLLVWQLGQIGYESFETEPGMLYAYIPKTAYDAESLKPLLQTPYQVETLPDKDWNEEWEKNFFQPIVIAGECVVHSTFHKDVPKARYDIAINPQMAFGTGHHATTSSMMAWILEDPFAGKAVLDMGCGTAILGILAAMRGADPVTGIDVDDWCIRNGAENCALNGVSIELLLGNADSLKGRRFDIVLANINRNILLSDMHAYADTLPAGGVLYMSGFYTEDIPLIAAEATRLGLRQAGVKEKDNWVAVKFVK